MTIGEILEYLRVYLPGQYDIVQVGQNSISLHGEVIATYTIHDSGNFPVFDFHGKFGELNQIQSQKRWEVLENLFRYPIYNTPKEVEGYRFIGHLGQRKPFSFEIYEYDVYFDADKMIIYGVDKDGNVSHRSLLSPLSLEMEKIAKQRSWAVIFTKWPK